MKTEFLSPGKRMSLVSKWVAAVLLALLVTSCTQAEPDPWNGPQLSQSRDQITVEDLQQPRALDLADMSYFTKPDWAGEAIHDLSGELTFESANIAYSISREPYDGEKVFPAFATSFITHEGELIPTHKEKIFTGDLQSMFWDVFVGVGEVWQEEGDGEWSRASFPLTLTDRWIGQVRNCVATFVYKTDTVSNVYVQCSQETSDLNDGRVGDMKAMLNNVVYKPMDYPEASQIIEEHEEYKSNRLPVLPLSTIDADGEIAGYFSKSLTTNAPTSLGAVVVDDTIYLHPPNTRHGPYPYPYEMRHGVYSVTKSMAGAMALFYIEERYEEDVFDALITDYVPALEYSPAWQGVTFSHTLNMATGTEGSESAEHLLNVLILARSAEESINNISRLGDYPEAPGEKYNYASTNLFVLSYALQSYVEEKEGPDVYYWDLIVEDVLEPIGAEYFSVRHTVEPDGSQGIPLLAYGANPTLDEAAKIAILIANEGEHEGQQLLDREKIREALGRSDYQGYKTDEPGTTYRHSFRSISYRPSIFCRVDVNFMLGFGANHVLFLPNDVIVIRFMDEYDFTINDLVRKVHQQVPLCP